MSRRPALSRNTFIISRTDAIGDVVLTLPVAGVLKSLYPSARILFLGRSYTEDIIKACEHIDGFLDWDAWRQLPAGEIVREMAATGADTIIHVFPDKTIARMAWKAGIRERIGTTNRLYHWCYCNIRVPLSRKNSPYHEAQLNLRLLVTLGARAQYSLSEIGSYYGLTRLTPLPPAVTGLLAPDRFNLILHPKSRGSAREWGLDNFRQLIALLPRERYKIFLTGTAAEGQAPVPFAAGISFSHRHDRPVIARAAPDVYLQSRRAGSRQHGPPAYGRRPGYPCAGDLSADPAYASGPLGPRRQKSKSLCKGR